MINVKGLDVDLSKDCTTIYDSYKLKSRDDIKEFIGYCRTFAHDDYAIYKRDIDSQANEWLVHNLLYKLHIFRSHTKDVDIQYLLAWYERIIYNSIGKWLR